MSSHHDISIHHTPEPKGDFQNTTAKANQNQRLSNFYAYET